MGHMSITAEHLNTDGYEDFNLTLITGGIAEFLSLAMDQELDSWSEHYELVTGKELPDDWFDEITWDWEAMYKEYAEDFPRVLEEAFEDIFTTDPEGTAPVVIGEVFEAHTNDPGGWGREYVMAKVKIDGDKLKEIATDQGITEIHDGREIDGFIRTADDNYWSQIQVLKDLIESLDPWKDWYYSADESASADGWVTNHIGVGRFQEELDEL